MANKKGKIADGDSSSSANSLGVNTFSTSGANTISTNTNTNNSLSSSSSSNNSINGATASTTATTSNNITARRRRSTLKDLQQAALNNSTHPKAPSENANATKLVTRKIDASSPMYQGNERSLIQRIMGGFGAIWWDTLPYWLSVGLMLGLIFGGCCSNVYALEKIVKPFPDTGMSCFSPPSIHFEDLSLALGCGLAARWRDGRYR